MKSKKKVIMTLLVFGIVFALSIISNYNFSYFPVNNEMDLENKDEMQLKSAFYDWDPQITRSVGDAPYSVFIGDANNDGHNDIVTANVNDDNVSILVWNEISGDWDPQITRSVGVAPVGVFIGDANNDGLNDIVTANYADVNVSILVWNEISGDWDPQITRSVGHVPYSVFIGDANNDGLKDIVTANSNDENVSILVWNGVSGDWDAQITKSVGNVPVGVFIGDANNDGLNDIVTANSNDDNVSILVWNEISGDWDPQITRSVGGYPVSVFIEDANNDGYKDIVTANLFDNNISILVWNEISGDWDPQITGSVGDYPVSVFIGDANNDGHNDIVTANRLSNNVSILVWNEISGDWGPQITRSVGHDPYSVFIGDANNDGWNDIVTVNRNDDNVSILLWNGPPTITINTPENITYIEPMSGYYPATYGFENDAIGEFQPEGFNNFYSTSCSGETISEIDGHKRVFRAYDNNAGGSAIVMQRFNEGGFQNQTYGTIEFWFRVTSISRNTEIRLNWGYGVNDASIVLRINRSGQWEHNNGTWNQLPNISNPLPNTWYHIEIHFRCQAAPSYVGLSEDQFEIIINGVSSGSLSFITSTTEIAMFMPIYTAWGPYGGNYAYLDAIGYSWDPNYNIGDNLNEGLLLSFETNSFLDWNWMGYSLNGQANRTILGNKTFPIPDDGPHTIQVFGNTSIGFMVQSDIRHFSIDTKIPEIDINLPIQNKIFGIMAPGFYISINEINLVSTWYTIDNGLTNFTFTGLFGYIDQNAWNKAPNGPITITFYAKDIADNEGSKDVIVIKNVVKLLRVDLIDQSFSTEEFNITFSVYNEAGQGIDFATIQMWWDGINVSASVQNLGGGLYQASLNPIFVESGEDPILLNMTISASGYNSKYFETYLAAEPCSVSNLLYVEIIDQSFSTEEFDIKFYIYNGFGQAIDFATIQTWWDGIDVSASVQNLGSGLFTISLTPITVAPGEDPILLNMTISASGYNEKYFEADFAVEEGPPFALIIAIIASIAGGGVAVIITTALLYRKRRKIIE